MVTASLTKVGNGAAAFIPSVLRKKASANVGDAYDMDSPREGVIVIRFKKPYTHSKLETWLRAQANIQALKSSLPAWQQDTTADDLIQAGKEARSHEILSA